MITLALICSVQETYLDIATQEPHIEHIFIEGQKGRAEGVTPDKKGLRARFRNDGSISIHGAKTAFGSDTWAELKKTATGYDLAWEMIGEYAKDGTHSIAAWKVGTCTPANWTRQ